MPRRSLAEERTAQILDAFERCVASNGLEGTSLEGVAQEAGVKRSILRHYIGNREELVLAMARRLAARYSTQLRDLITHVGESNRIERLVDTLFSSTSAEGFRDVVIVEALIAASEDDAEIRDLMTGIIEETIETVRGVLGIEHPDVSASTLWAVASGIVGIYFNHASLRPLALSRRHRLGAKEAALRLVRSIAGS